MGALIGLLTALLLTLKWDTGTDCMMMIFIQLLLRTSANNIMQDIPQKNPHLSVIKLMEGSPNLQLTSISMMFMEYAIRMEAALNQINLNYTNHNKSALPD